MDDTHRKIELQSSEDLRYLIANVTRLARAQIDTQLPADDTSSGREGMEEAVDAVRWLRYCLDVASHTLMGGALENTADI